ncbi:MAG: hypothetical protein H8E46_08830 [FCB group bacterium]|nr:hypothetical protein [FCB group bacterium]
MITKTLMFFCEDTYDFLMTGAFHIDHRGWYYRGHPRANLKITARDDTQAVFSK